MMAGRSVSVSGDSAITASAGDRVENCFTVRSALLEPPGGNLRFSDRLDQIPFSHRRPAGDLLFLRQLVELLAVAVLQRVSRLAAAPPAAGGLLPESASRLCRQARDRPLAS